ncbi:putative mEMBRANE PROTEIN [Mycobacterium xenopi 3993]|nr:putative mEMBRANE PROTEIN [Mycobacterium xenopi 3993]
MALITPLMFAGAVGAAAPRFPGPAPATRDTGITPVAAVTRSGADLSRPTVIAVTRRPSRFRVAAATLSAPPPRSSSILPGAGNPEDGAVGLPQCRANHGRVRSRLRCQLEPAGRHRPYRVDARQRWRHRRARHCDFAHLRPGARRHTARQRDRRPKQHRRPGDLRAGDGADAIPTRNVGTLRVRRRRRRGGRPQNLYDSTLAAARYLCSGGSICGIRRR